MGIPQHYSLELPARCLRLLEICDPVVMADGDGERFGGPLTTTLLLALATPIVSFPFERVYKNIGLGEEQGTADDRRLNTAPSQRLEVEIARRKLKENEHFGNLGWSFVSDVPPFNIADELKPELADQLQTDETRDRARQMPMAQFVSCLRNAMAHSGIMYLDREGRTSHGQAEMLLFVSAKQSWSSGSSRPVTESLRLLRIPQDDFRHFLTGWVRWLEDLGVLEDMKAA